MEAFPALRASAPGNLFPAGHPVYSQHQQRAIKEAVSPNGDIEGQFVRGSHESSSLRQPRVKLSEAATSQAL